MTVAPWRLTLGIVLSLGLALALVVWIVGGGGGAAARPATAAERAAVASSSAAAASSAAALAHQAALAALSTTLDGALGGGGDTWSLSVVDLGTHVETDLGADSQMYAGSTVKVLLLETLLRTGGGVDGLSRTEEQQATAMITESDNAAAVQVWDEAGGDDALQETVDLLGLTHTSIGTGGYFGTTTTSAADQVKVLAELVTPTFLTVDDVAFVNGLMGDVETDQRWGVPTIADAGSTVENKNGWLDNDADDGNWLVNSMGIVTVGGTRYLVAALSQHHPDFDTGVDRLDAALADVATALRQGIS